MPWRESSVMEERLRFVARLLDGEGMSDVCRSFGISRKTGYKLFNRYKAYGLDALQDRSRRPVRYANQLPEQIEQMIVRLKKEKPHWGARKMRLVQDAIERGDYVREIGLCGDLDVFGLFAYRDAGAVLINSLNFRIDHLDIRVHSQAELEARRVVPLIAAFLREHFPGFEHAQVSDSAAMVGVRYTRWIDAGFDLTAQHVDEGAQFDDVVGALGAYARHPRGGIVHPPRVAELPYRIMLPQNVENLVVASGKSVSTDPRGWVRGQLQGYVLGQAAGVSAAVAVQSSTTTREVDIRKVQRELLRQNVYLGDAARLGALGLP